MLSLAPYFNHEHALALTLAVFVLFYVVVLAGPLLLARMMGRR